MDYPSSTVIISMLYMLCNGQKLAEWLKKGTSPQLPLERAEGKEGRFQCKLSQLKQYHF